LEIKNILSSLLRERESIITDGGTVAVSEVTIFVTVEMGVIMFGLRDNIRRQLDEEVFG
jgi:hypothetical protein